MKVRDPGHLYELQSLDGDETQTLRFVKREGERYPGNVGHYAGTTMQEVLRALIERCEYVNGQIACAETEAAVALFRTALLLFEVRAARVHNRSVNLRAVAGIEREATCERCGHIQCEPSSTSESEKPQPDHTALIAEARDMRERHSTLLYRRSPEDGDRYRLIWEGRGDEFSVVGDALTESQRIILRLADALEGKETQHGV